MSDQVTAITGSTLPWGQENKSTTNNGQTSSGSTESTAPADGGGTTTQTGSTSTAPDSQTSSASTSPTSGTSSGQTSGISTSGSSGDSYQVTPMQPRLRDLLAELARAPEPTALGKLRFDPIERAEVPGDTGQTPLLAADIIVQAARSMVAQATLSRESVLALVESGSLAGETSYRPVADPAPQ